MNLLSRFKNPVSEEPAEQDEGPRPRARHIGEILRDRREELGLDLDSLGEALRIKPAYLAALEQGRSHDLPGPAYAIGFVRAYSHHLGFDSEKVLARFRTESSTLQSRPDLTLPVPLGERSLPGAAVLVVALILGLCGYGTWYYLSTGEQSRPERVAAVPASLRPAAEGPDSASSRLTEPSRPLQPVPPTTAQATAQATAPSVAAPSAPQATPPSAAAPATSGRQRMVSGLFSSNADDPVPDTTVATPPLGTALPPADTVSEPSNTTAAEAPPTAAPAADGPKAQLASATPDTGAGARIAIKALSDCWIQVRAPDQSIVFSRVLKSGETYQVPVKSGLFLRTGNAGALQIAVDGKPAPSIGSVGTLRRNVALDPEALLGGTAVHG